MPKVFTPQIAWHGRDSSKLGKNDPILSIDFYKGQTSRVFASVRRTISSLPLSKRYVSYFVVIRISPISDSYYRHGVCLFLNVTFRILLS